MYESCIIYYWDTEQFKEERVYFTVYELCLLVELNEDFT